MIKITEKTNIKRVITKEKKLVSSYNDFETSIKENLQLYIDEFKQVTFENELLKTMVLNNFANALSQVDNNLLNIQSLSNILDILENQDEVSSTDVDTYNKLATKIDKDMELLQNFLCQTISSFDNIPIQGKKKSITVLNNCKEVLLQKFSSADTTASTSTSTLSQDKQIVKTRKSPSKTIKKKFDFSTSDLLCFFPKKPSDSLVISTSQENYSISFKDNVANIYIEDEDFNLSLKTSGVQISNSNTKNILFVSHVDAKYTIITNSEIEIPPFIQVSKVSKNDDFLEIEINSNFVNLDVEDGIISFKDSSYSNAHSTPKHAAFQPDEFIDLNNKNTKCNDKNSIYESIPISNIAGPVAQTPENVSLTESAEIVDNDTLVISDTNKNVILPYKVVDLESKLKNNKKYKSLQDVINNEYTIPIETFKNPTKSRFREAFQLMKKKEHGSLKEAIELGFELMFQSDLNPAVIAACKDLDELDIYLDCLDDNELDKFSCFKIKYDIPPTKKSKR